MLDQLSARSAAGTRISGFRQFDPVESSPALDFSKFQPHRMVNILLATVARPGSSAAVFEMIISAVKVSLTAPLPQPRPHFPHQIKEPPSPTLNWYQPPSVYVS